MACSAEPDTAILRLDGVMVGQQVPPLASVELGPTKRGEPVAVKLGQSYEIGCTVKGGNLAPNVTLASDLMPYSGVVVRRSTVRDVHNRVSEPQHTVNATFSWTPTVQNIGIPFNCSSGIEDRRAVWTSFVPVVTDRELLHSHCRLCIV